MQREIRFVSQRVIYLCMIDGNQDLNETGDFGEMNLLSLHTKSEIRKKRPSESMQW